MNLFGLIFERIKDHPPAYDSPANKFVRETKATKLSAKYDLLF